MENPQKAPLGFTVEKVDVSRLKIIDGPRGPVGGELGEDLRWLLQTGMQNAILKMDFERTMRWGNVPFSCNDNPIHKLIVLFGTEHISCKVGTVCSGTMDTGHRLFFNTI